jgi:3-dehydroquinate dehydratase-2
VSTAGKSIGKRTVSGQLHIGLTREDVRKRIAERLSGRLSPGGLATWARQQWQELQRGAPCETGQRDRLEDVLQSLLLSQASKASDEQLIDLMTQLA